MLLHFQVIPEKLEQIKNILNVQVSNKAVCLGNFDSVTTIDVAKYKPRSLNDFVLASPQTAIYQHINIRRVGDFDVSMQVTVQAGTLSLNGNMLTIHPASVSAGSYNAWGSERFAICYSSCSDTLPVQVYYVGSV